MKLNKKPKEQEKLKIPIEAIVILGIIVVLGGSCFLSSFLSGFQGQTMEQMKPVTPTPVPASTSPMNATEEKAAVNPTANDELIRTMTTALPAFMSIAILITIFAGLSKIRRY